MISEARPSVVVLGGGYAGFTLAKSLDDVADVTLVDPSDTFMHNVASWRTLVEPEWLDRIFLPFDGLLRHGRFVRDQAVAVDGRRVTLASGRRLEPDYLVLATGSSYPFPAKSDVWDAEKTRARMLDAHDALRGARRVLVVGAGPSGLELAGEIKAFFPDKHVTIADIGADVMPGPFDQALRDELRAQVHGLGIELKLGSPLKALPEAAPATLSPISITTEAGDELTADIWFRCFGVEPRTGYLTGALAEARDARGYVRVDEYLRAGGVDRVYAIGDIADADRDTVGSANAQATLVAANIRGEITGSPERTAYEKIPPMVIVPLGPEGGAGQLPGQGVFGAEQASGIKGATLFADVYAEMFNVPAGSTRK
ncbi:hypothetical protein Aph01nite_40420 [Acrocarpospora phusangensis]|uniref:FAD/NAD(P)-binding domain-containing protein n=1 Tax=Acrocarpospora phusangensis TaxID=1070424 RepID=A0A919QB94_9ACTN|nr:FAD-dependent oxidoreductase [Acrocarpospora phusangensis]GIH25732.1 hypothetical protein Aph01nite_40420 [Acrocarpospora phusangensis]